ncbi:MAG: hypothetical protein IEMM0002_0973 [bacterium]|nr:MAG: hypothetical protein IEMM0002_0973 [bacterium]
MKKLPVLKSREVIRALIKVGFQEFRQKGSHKILKREKLLVVVPSHPRDLKKGTIKNIIEHANLTIEEFIKLL